MGIGATGEGIETIEQLRALRDLGCQYGQGYFLGRPVAADVIAAMTVVIPMPAESKRKPKPPAATAA